MIKYALKVALSLFFFTLSLVSTPHLLADQTNFHFKRLDNLLFNPQYSLLIASYNKGQSGCIRFWSIEDGKLIHNEELGNNNWAFLIASSHDGNSLAVALASHEIGCYSIKDKKWLWKAKWVEKGTSNLLLFSPDDQAILAIGSENIIYYDAKTGEIRKTQKEALDDYPTRLGTLKQIAISLTANYIVVWQMRPEALAGHGILGRLFSNRAITVWDMKQNKKVASWRREREMCSAVFSPDEKNIIFGTEDGHIQEWSSSTQKIVRDWRFVDSVPTDEIDSMALSSNGKYLAAMGDGGKTKRLTIRIWEYSTEILAHEFSDITSGSIKGCGGYPMAFSPDSNEFAFEYKGNLCLYDMQTWSEKWCITL